MLPPLQFNATMSRQIAMGGVGAAASIERRSCSEQPRLKEAYALCLQVWGRWGGANYLGAMLPSEKPD